VGAACLYARVVGSLDLSFRGFFLCRSASTSFGTWLFYIFDPPCFFPFFPVLTRVGVVSDCRLSRNDVKPLIPSPTTNIPGLGHEVEVSGARLRTTSRDHEVKRLWGQCPNQ